jgi:hypothetical protein
MLDLKYISVGMSSISKIIPCGFSKKENNEDNIWKHTTNNPQN